MLAVLLTAALGIVGRGIALDTSSAIPGTTRGRLDWQMPFGTGQDTDTIWSAILTDGPPEVRFKFHVHAAANLGDATRGDQTAIFGFNINSGGGRSLAGVEPGVGMSMEHCYNPAGAGCTEELHLIFLKSDGQQVRLLTADKPPTDVVTIGLNADSIYFSDPPANDTWLQFSSHAMLLNTSDGQLSKQHNNVGWLNQLNAAGNGFRSTVKINGTDQVEIGDSSTNGVLVAGAATGRFLEIPGGTEPSAPADGSARLWTNSTTKDQLCVRFHTGASQCFATEP